MVTQYKVEIYHASEYSIFNAGNHLTWFNHPTNVPHFKGSGLDVSRCRAGVASGPATNGYTPSRTRFGALLNGDILDSGTEEGNY